MSHVTCQMTYVTCTFFFTNVWSQSVDSLLSPGPTPLIHLGGFYDNLIKFKYYPHRLTSPPLPPLSTFQFFLNICLIIFFLLSSVSGSNRPNTTKYALKRPKKYKNPYPHCLTPLPLPLSTFQHFIIILYF